MKYARTTTVPIERSREEIERTLHKYGADQFLYGRDKTRVLLGFRLQGLNIQLKVPLPEDEQERRQVMRVLLLMLKSKLEMIEMEFTTVAREFMADLLLPDGSTVGEFVLPQIIAGKMPRSLPLLSSDETQR